MPEYCMKSENSLEAHLQALNYYLDARKGKIILSSEKTLACQHLVDNGDRTGPDEIFLK